MYIYKLVQIVIFGQVFSFITNFIIYYVKLQKNNFYTNKFIMLIIECTIE